MSNDKKNNAAALASANYKEQTQIPEVEEQPITIMPTMLDESDTGESKRKVDLSAIIPTDDASTAPAEEKTEAAMFLESKDKTLKTDGVVVIGTLTEDSAVVESGAKFPDQIDMEIRKKQQQDRLKGKRKTKKVRTQSEELKRSQTITSLIVLALIGVLVGAVYYIMHRKTERDFMPLNVTVELGEKLPLRTAEYVKPGIGKNVNEMEYILDKSQIKVDEVGEYQFTVTYKGIKKTGKVIIQDTTSPVLKVENKIITEGTSYTAETFVTSCEDWSGCNYSFQDAKTLEKYREAGEYELYVVATDPYGNSTTSKVKLTIEEQGKVFKYMKNEPYDSNKGYSLKITYDLHFTDFIDNPILLRGYETREYTYQDETKYAAAVNENRGNQGWSFDDTNKVITYQSEAKNTIDTYSSMTQLLNYLESSGFTRM